MKNLFRILCILLLIAFFFLLPKPAHALTTYFQDNFSNAVSGLTPEQVDSTDYISKAGYFYDIPDFTYDNRNGVWSNGNQSAGVVLKSTSFNQNYYCAGETLLRNINDTRSYPAIQLNTTGN